MDRIKSISPWQFAFFRIGLGLYLAVHFFQLLPYAGELFSAEGLLPDPAANFTHGILPNPLDHANSATAATLFVGFLGLAALLFAAGIGRPIVALILWFGWACLFNRNNLISNPGIPYVGLLLLICAVIPPGEPLRLWPRPSHTPWHMPAVLYWTAWILLAAGYTYSGYWKLQSPSWLDGTALQHVLVNPLARPGFITDLLLQLPPPFLKLLTWSALAGELLALPLLFHRQTRLISWIWMLTMHVGIVLTVDFADLTLAMILIHGFVFDPEWLPPDTSEKSLVLFDGECALCSSSVHFLIDEDRAHVLSFAPLQGGTAAGILPRHGLSGTDLNSMILVRSPGTDQERIFIRSAAALEIVRVLGGFWKLFYGATLVPRPLRDAIYNLVARHRYQWFGRHASCWIPSPELRDRILD